MFAASLCCGCRRRLCKTGSFVRRKMLSWIKCPWQSSTCLRCRAQHLLCWLLAHELFDSVPFLFFYKFMLVWLLWLCWKPLQKLLWPPWVCLLNVPTGQVCWIHHKVGAPADLKCTEARPWELKLHVLCCSMHCSKFNVMMHCSMLAVTTQLSMSRSASLRTWRPPHPEGCQESRVWG